MRRPEAWQLALLLAMLAAATLAAAWAFELAGYVPCELCLKERIPYYLAVPVALVTLGAALRGRRAAALGGFTLLMLLMVGGLAFALYHAGVEWKVWPGPTECSGSYVAPAKIDDFLAQLHHTAVVRCDEPALRILGLSLAAWNVLICLVLLALANAGLLRCAGLSMGRGVARS